MPWFKVDDNLAFHPKVASAGNAAIGLWVRCGSWCAQQLTDGFIPTQIARSLGSTTQIAKLIDVGLWVKVDGGYQFHQWSERQPLRNEIEGQREESKKRMQEWRQRRRLRAIDGDNE